MSLETLVSTPALEASEVIDALVALRTSGDALAELVDGVFDDLEVLGNEVALRTGLVEEAKRQAAEHASELQLVRHAEALAKAELTALRREIEQAHEQLTELPQQNEQLREHLHALEVERRGLETELEGLRVRTAELADHLAEVKRETAEERVEWSTELKQLRRTLERQADLLADRLAMAQAGERSAGEPTATPATVEAAPPNGAPATKDVVLGSVVAQFEMLQRDRQRRRGP